ncbi:MULTISPECIES: hypothetical protein [Escherichia]|uniref:hypothetical protein n=1 Tax=Escherichia TaxID=561 RepID=UPI000CF7ACF2|nr:MULTISPECIES: hypothetical protein [unclassified Escherichia]EFN2279318.1 hypothetical protein [Escherichia coli]EFU2678053.1 hypothetical protein [Escherichia coli]MBB2426190.1 hypothetical protein [Escherichia sp. 11.1597]
MNYKILMPIIAATCLTISGCARKVVPPYNAIRMDDNIYEISVPETINNNHSKHRYLLYRAGQQAQQQGCEYFFAINNAEQNIVSKGKQRMDDDFIQTQGNSYYISNGTYYKIIFPKLSTHVFACTKEKPTGLLPGLVFRASYVVQNPPTFKTPGIHFNF